VNERRRRLSRPPPKRRPDTEFRSTGRQGRKSGQENAAPERPWPIWIKDLGESSQADECAQGQRHFGPFAGLALRRQEGQPDESGQSCSHDGEGEAFEGSEKAEPGCDHGYQLGVAEAHAFFAPDEPVGQADAQDESGWDKGFQDAPPELREPVQGAMAGCLRPGAQESEDESQSDARQGEPVGQPEMLGVERGQCCEQPGEERVSEEFDEREGLRMGCAGRGCGREKRPAEAEPACCPEKAHDQLNEGIAEADPCAALTATAAQEEPTQEGDILPPGEGVDAVAAMGAGRGDAFVFGQACDEDV